MPGRLAGKVALVSGAGGGKGLALARTLSREGARVVISDIKEDEVRGNAAEFGPDVVRSIRLNVTKEDEWADAVAFTTETYGRLDILVNSARTNSRGDLETFSMDAWRNQFAVNLDGAFLGIRQALPALRASGAGSIVNVVSLSAVEPYVPTPAYSAAHAALLNLTKTVAITCARAGDNVRANAVVCGMSVNSPIEDIGEAARKVIPVGRPANPEDIANGILWFASDESSYATGSTIVLDGGFSAEGYPEI